MHEWTRALESIATAAKAVMDLRESADWKCAFDEANRSIEAVEGYRGSIATFALHDVSRVVAREDGENDERDWLGVFELADGRFVFVAAGCDYTGWDCRAHGHTRVAATLTDLVRWGIGQNERARFGDQLPVIDPA